MNDNLTAASSYEIYLGKVCISQADLISTTIKVNGEKQPMISSESNLKLMTHRGKITKARIGGKGRKALYEVDSFPYEMKQAIIEQHGSLEGYKLKLWIDQHYKSDFKARAFYNGWFICSPDGTKRERLKTPYIDQYTANAELLQALGRMVMASMPKRKASNNPYRGKAELWANLANDLDKVQSFYGANLPTNPRRLEEKYKALMGNGEELDYSCLISGKFFNNGGRKKVVSQEQQALLAQLARNPNNLDSVLVADTYNEVAQAMGWETISDSKVKQFRRDEGLFLETGRMGITEFRNSNKEMMVKRSRPSRPMLMWNSDGWVAELLYQKTTLNKKQHSVTTYHNRLTVVFVMDPYNDYPVGYAVGEDESPALIREAHRNAIKHVEMLFGERMGVYQLQTDNYGRGNLVDFYKNCSAVYTPAKVKNAKSKTIEPAFGELTKKYAILFRNYAGPGVKSSKKNKPNYDWKNLIDVKKSYPDEKEVRQQIDLIVERIRAKKRDEYISNYMLTNNEKVLIDDYTWFTKLCEKNKKTIKISHNGLMLQKDNIRYNYDTFDLDYRRYTHLDWSVYFDPCDVNKIMIVNEDKGVRFLLEEKYVQPMALLDRKEGDAEELHNVWNFNETLEEIIQDKMNEDYRITQRVIGELGPSENMLVNALLTDSLGQHKNELSAARNGRVMLAKQLAKEEKAIQRSQQEEHYAYVENKIDVDSYEF